jgi:hypothetical protein
MVELMHALERREVTTIDIEGALMKAQVPED